MKTIFRNMQKYDRLTDGVCNEIISTRFDINGYVENSFCCVALKLEYCLILGKLWMIKTVFNTFLNPNVYGFDFQKWKVEHFFEKKMKLDSIQIF